MNNLGYNMNSQSTELIHDNVETVFSLPDHGDWDPNYSDKLLLQEGGSDESCLTTEFGRSMNLGSSEPWSGFGRLNHVSNSSSSITMQGINGPSQIFSNVEMGSFQHMILKQHIYPLSQSLFISCRMFCKILQNP
ncbi:hypothetical protein RYX36_030631 [Vicia faba]